MPIRLPGLVTGMDTDSLIKQMMTAKRMPIDRLKQQQTLLEWKRDSYRESNTMMSQLRDMSFKMRLQSTMGAKSATISDESIVSASPAATAANGSYTIKVNEVAAAASLKSDVLGFANRMSEPANPTQAFTLNVTGEKGSKAITIEQNSSIEKIVNTINSQTAATGVKASYDKVTDRLYFNSTTTGSQSLISISGTDAASESFLTGTLKVAVSATDNQVVTGSKVFPNNSTVINKDLAAPVEFSINGEKLTITKTTTIADLQDQLSRSAAGANVSITLDANGKVRLESNAPVALANVTGQGLEELGLNTATTSLVKTATVRGTDASVDFNGLTNIKFHTNTITQGDINFTLKAKGTVTVTIGVDSKSVVDTIKSFVEKFNEVLDKTYAKTHEQSKRDFKPLTEEQKKEMKEDEIKKWEEQAKKGLLRNDSILNTALNEMRYALTNPLAGIGAGQLALLAEVGITTGAYNERGKLYLDEAKLKQAMTNKPDEVMNLFTKQGTRYNPNTTVNGTKQFQSMDDVIDSTITGTSSLIINGKTYSITSTTKLSDLAKSIAETSAGKVSLYLNADRQVVIQSSGTTPLDMSNNDGTNALGKLGHVPGVTDHTKVTGTKSFAANSDVINGSLSSPIRFTLNGTYISIDKTTTVNDLMTRVSAATGGTVTLSRDAGTGQLTLQGAADTKVVITNTDAGVDALAQLGFSSTPHTEGGVLTDFNAVGFGHRLYDVINNAMSKITEKAGTVISLKDTSILGEQISDLQTRVRDQDKRMVEVEQRYYNQFAKLEAYISRMNSQSDWLSQQMMSMGGGR